MKYAAFVLTVIAGFGLSACGEDLVEPEFELEAGLFDEFDADADGLLTEAEFDVGFENEGVFDELDADFDGFLRAEEFDDDLGAFGDFDLDDDSLLTEDEFLDGTFDAFDTDDDLFVDETEFGIGVELF